MNDPGMFAITNVEGRPDLRSVWVTNCDQFTKLIKIHKWDTSMPYVHPRAFEYRCSLETSVEIDAALTASGLFRGVLLIPNDVIIPVAPMPAVGDGAS